MKAPTKIPVVIWEELHMAFGVPIWFTFGEKGELKWSGGIPYRVYKQG